MTKKNIEKNYTLLTNYKDEWNASKKKKHPVKPWRNSNLTTRKTHPTTTNNETTYKLCGT